MTNENRFTGLVGQLKAQGKTKDTGPTQPNPQDTPKAKRNNPNYLRTTLYLPKTLHKRMKTKGIELEMEISEIAAQAIDAWLSKHSDD